LTSSIDLDQGCPVHASRYCPRTVSQEIYMKARMTLAMVGTVVLAATPLASYAGSNHALDACVKAFVENYISKDTVVRVHKQAPPLSPLGILQDRRGMYTIALTARGKHSGKEIAQARCIASARGEVIVMDSPPADTYVAKADFTASIAR
jgi:hypothetical protein